jgi:molybdopterin converting factor small subunit
MSTSPRRNVFITEADGVPLSPGDASFDISRRQARGDAGGASLTFARIRLKHAVKKINKLNTTASKFDFPTIDSVKLPKLRLGDGSVFNPLSAAVEAFHPEASSPTASPGSEQLVGSVGPSTVTLSLDMSHVPHVLSMHTPSQNPHGPQMFEYAVPVFPMQTEVSEVIERVLDAQPIQVLDRLGKPVIDWFLGPQARDLMLDAFWLCVLQLRTAPTAHLTAVHADLERRIHHHMAVTFGNAFRGLTDRAVAGRESEDAWGTREVVLDVLPLVTAQTAYWALTHLFPQDAERNTFGSNFRRALYQRLYFWTTGVVPQVANVKNWLSGAKENRLLPKGTQASQGDDLGEQSEAPLSPTAAGAEGGTDALRLGSPGSGGVTASAAASPTEARLSLRDSVRVSESERQRLRLKRKSTFQRAMHHRSPSFATHKDSMLEDLTSSLRSRQQQSKKERRAQDSEIARALGRTTTRTEDGTFHPTRHSGAGRWYERGYRRGYRSTERVGEFESASENLVDLAFPLMPEVSPLGMMGGATGTEDSARMPRVRPTGGAISGGTGAGGHAGSNRSPRSHRSRRRSSASINASPEELQLTASQRAMLDRGSYAAPDFVTVTEVLLGDDTEGLRGATRRMLATQAITTESLKGVAVDRLAKQQQSLVADNRTREEREREIAHVRTERNRQRGTLGTHSPLLLYYYKHHLRMDDVYAPIGKPIPFTKLSEVDRASKGAKFSQETARANAKAAAVHQADAEGAEADRRRRLRDEEARRELEKRWRVKVKYVGRVLEVAAHPRSEEHTTEAAAVAKQLREALFERGKDVRTIIARYDAALAAAQHLVFALPHAHRKLLWDIGLQCKLRLLHWQRSSPHNFRVLGHQLSDADRVLLEAVVAKITAQRPDLTLTRSWQSDGTVDEATSLWGISQQEALDPPKQRFKFSDHGSTRASSPPTHSTRPHTPPIAKPGDTEWNYVEVIATLERRRAEKEAADKFSAEVDGLLQRALRKKSRRVQDGHEVDDGKQSRSPSDEGASSTDNENNTQRPETADARILGAVGRTADDDLDAVRAHYRQAGHVLDEATLRELVEMRHGEAVVGANTLVSDAAMGVVADPNAAPKQHFEEVDDDRIGKYLQSKLTGPIAPKKAKREQWQRTWTVTEGEEVSTEPPLTDPNAVPVEPVTESAASFRRAQRASPLSSRALLHGSPHGSFRNMTRSGAHSPEATAAAALSLANTSTFGAHMTTSVFLSTQTFTDALNTSSTGGVAVTSPAFVPVSSSWLPPIASPRKPDFTSSSDQPELLVDAALPIVDAPTQETPRFAPPEAVDSQDKLNARRHIELSTPPTNGANPMAYRSRITASLGAAGHRLARQPAANGATPAATALPTVPLTARQKSNAADTMLPSPPARPSGPSTARPARTNL